MAGRVIAERLHREDGVSLGKAAELAGMSIVAYMDLLRSKGQPVVEYGEEEFRQDLEAACSIAQASQALRRSAMDLPNGRTTGP